MLAKHKLALDNEPSLKALGLLKIEHLKGLNKPVKELLTIHSLVEEFYESND